MNKIAVLLIVVLSACHGILAQSHFIGFLSNKRVGMLHVGYNPAELSNLTNKHELNLVGASVAFGSNKLSISDIRSGIDLKNRLFASSETPLILDLNSEIMGPSLGVKYKKWGFGILTKAFVRVNVSDLDVALMNSIYDNTLLTMGSFPLSNPYNQRINSASWGQMSFAISRQLLDKNRHQLSLGIAVSALFPASYANIGLDKFSGTIKYNLMPPQANLINTTTKLNLAYTNNFAKSFTKPDDFTKAIWGDFGGASIDLGLTYQYLDDNNIPLFNFGVSVKNLGSLNYQAKNLNSVDYAVDIPAPSEERPGFNLISLATISNLNQLENLLISSGYMSRDIQSNSDVRVKLPTTIQAYTSVRVLNRLSLDVNTQYNLREGGNNREITNPNTVTLIPRFQTKYVELYSPWTSHEVTGINGGLGIRVAGFYLGSGSVITAIQNDSKQMDFYAGYQIGF